mmetsp:Transcript_5067/g.18775  ORF Transcript_5067/g.18775 Transcript_5067/m.18775 type:complete len:252 (+) Transcript_5067:2671-3426(+)
MAGLRPQVLRPLRPRRRRILGRTRALAHLPPVPRLRLPADGAAPDCVRVHRRLSRPSRRRALRLPPCGVPPQLRAREGLLWRTLCAIPLGLPRHPRRPQPLRQRVLGSPSSRPRAAAPARLQARRSPPLECLLLPLPRRTRARRPGHAGVRPPQARRDAGAAEHAREHPRTPQPQARRRHDGACAARRGSAGRASGGMPGGERTRRHGRGCAGWRADHRQLPGACLGAATAAAAVGAAKPRAGPGVDGVSL